ncbi:MoxR family ATPase [Candidatus Woesearchaeota archaeon]|nr:MoxR family ATPase [Candidatus Woesearchaeota archaeon]
MVGMDEIKKKFDTVFSEINKVIVGQEDVVEQTLIALLCNGHVYLEGYPGLAKTLLVRTLANIMDLKFSRIQGTPDLLPSDITGTYVIDESKGKKMFKFQNGPIFSNVVLVDEVNRATPKTHSSILEAMQEHQVTVGNETYKLEKPFFVLATGNPIEQEGVFRLSEAQIDRFLFKINVGYPKFEDELKIVDRFNDKDFEEIALKQVFKSVELVKLQELVKHVPIANDLKKYAVELVASTRNKKDLIEYGASPRASLALVYASKARALMKGNKHVSKEDIKAVAFPVLRHRIILSFEAERKGMSEDDVIKELVKK